MTQARHNDRVIGPRNAAVLDMLSDAYAACLRLAAEGHVIAAVTITPEGTAPSIIIAPREASWQH